ncbi:MAG: alpha-L-fucosidase [Bacteroidota bacterium]
MKCRLILINILFCSLIAFSQNKSPVAQRLKWWQDAKMGLFVHWGPVSLIGKEISWSREQYGARKYDSLYLRFNPTKFNAKEWVALAKSAGMKYIVLTAKHHDGFCLFNTKTITYNISNTPFGRDVCKELAKAAHAAGMPIGWYFSVADWKDPDCRNPQTNAVFADRELEQLRELLTNYGKIDILWIDYEGWPSPIMPKRVYDLARKLQPQIIINNRLEPFTPDESHSYVGKYADYATPEGFVAGYGSTPWETCTNMGHQWAWRFNDKPRSLKESVHTLLRCVGGNGNLLFNIGPDSSGIFPLDFAIRAKEMGNWIAKNKEAIYHTKGGVYTPSTDYVSSDKGNKLFIHLLSKANEIKLPPIPAHIQKAEMLNGAKVDFVQKETEVVLTIAAGGMDSVATVIALTLDRPASKLKRIIPFTISHSLSYGKRGTASSSMGQFLHDPSAAFDDNPATEWKPGRRTDVNFDNFYGKSMHYSAAESRALYRQPVWLEVDLDKPETVGQIKLTESVKSNSAIKQFEVQYLANGKWVTLVSDTKMGNWLRKTTPVTAQRFRLHVTDMDPYIGIREFQLFAPQE